jgi:hypothetical protein
MADDDEVYEAEIVDDEQGGPAPLVPQDTILTPCHHGCTCGLHQQVVYGERVERHPPDDLDHGEMGLLVEAAADAAHLLNDFHDHFRELREVVTRTHGQARRALQELAVLLRGDAMSKARAERDRVEADYAGLTPAERQPAPRWLKAAAVAAVIGMAIFDAYFFQQTFMNILQVTVNDPWWKRDIGLVAAIVLAIGLIAAGRVLSGPLWRVRHRWRRPASPDDEPLRRVLRIARVLAVAAAPAVTFFILAWWAFLRGQAAVMAQRADANAPPSIPSGFSVMLLLLSLALTVIVLEILVYNPYLAEVRRADRALAKARKQIISGRDAVTEALDAHEIAWRDLRSARDEVISFVQAQLARPWQSVILPARLRHGKAGPKPTTPKSEVKIEVRPVATVNGSIAEVDQVMISYQIFEGMPQPQPGPGPLAEVVRAIIDLAPQALRAEQRRLEESLLAKLQPGEGDVPPGNPGDLGAGPGPGGAGTGDRL